MGFKNIVSLPLQFFHVIFLQPTVNCLYDGGEIKHRAWSESRNVLYSCEMLWSRSHSLYYKLCYGAESSFCQLRALAPAPDPEVEVAFRIFLLYFLLPQNKPWVSVTSICRETLTHCLPSLGGVEPELPLNV